MIPFENTWPYDIVMGDIYVQECPFCSAENVLLPLKPKQLSLIHDGKKHLLVFPCCKNRVTLLDNDQDYLLADQRLRSL
ncbi:hypothetical protein J45TS6_33530 [Paenibacillus sp. J45TS6]|uniref:Uncharacterized protein n=1 Tax=Paenibacillus polygoni TaxID=3050112 RepID=A0ABY8X583_9BACL|nr:MULTISPECIES: hypothetical protein [Paenibacillus]WIV18641.1 hypothetical protein QPK24_20110 [Paenibacillus polygoni]GIP44894.1 hypothetical protein J45TS6_33530 [Paenibacillus sp. J45TS6]